MKRLLSGIALCALVVGLAQPAGATLVSLPNNFTNGQIIDATQVMANYNALVNVINGNLDHANVGSVGFYASDLKPTNNTQATVGGAVPFIFPNGITLTVPLALASGGTNTATPACGSNGTNTTVSGTFASTCAWNVVAAPTLTGTNFTGIPNSALTNSSLTITAGTGLSGCGLISLGGSCTLATANIPNASLTNSTISGVALGGTLFTLTFGTHLQATDSSYNGAAAKTISTDCSSNPGVASKLFCTDGSGNGTLQAFSATTVQINGAGLFNEPGVGTTVASIGCSLWGVKSGGTQELCADTSGNVGLAGSLYMASSRSLKRDIVPLNDALGIMRSLRIVTFNYRAEPFGMDRHVGIIADDAPAIIAGKAHRHEDIASLVGVNSRVIQQLMAKVDSLENQVHALKARLRK